MRGMEGRRRFPWLKALAGLAAVLAAAGLFYYLRPLTVLNAARDVVLWSRGVESGYVTVDGHRLHYLAQGQGPPLVILIGLASEAADASPLMNAFAPHRRVYVLDYLGSGRSDRPPADYGVALHARHAAGFLDAKGLKGADLLGVSLGGWVALTVAADRPDLARRVVAASSGGLDFETTLTRDTFAPRSLAELDRVLALQTVKPVRPPRHVARDLLRRWQAQNPVVRQTMASMLTRRDVLDRRLGEIRQPVLVIWGDQDRVIPAAVGRRLASGLPRAEYAELRGCGHLAVLECKDAFVSRALAFLERR